jgi:hypothetical protein
VPALQRFGPFSVGHAVAGWTIESLTLSDRGVVVALTGAPGRARFELTCAVSELRSPFDLGPAHLFYSNDVEFRDLEAVGQALRARVRSAVGDQDVCTHLASWRAAAQTSSQ